MAWLSAASSSAAAAAATARAALLPPSPRGAVAAMQLLSLAGARLTAAATAAAAARTATAAARLLPSSAASAAAGPPSPGGPLSPARPGAAAAAFPSLLLTAAAAVPRHPLPLHQQQQQQQQSQRSLHAPSLFFSVLLPAAAAPPRTGNSLRFCSSSGSAAAGESSAQEKIVVVPSMGDSITEGSLGSWKKAVGDYVKEGEVVAVIDTDKVSVDVTSPAAGRLVHVFAAAAGDTVTVGKPLFTLDISAKAAEAAAATATPQQQQPAPHAKEGSSKPPPSPSPSSSSAEQQPPKPLPPPSPHAAPPATASPPSHTKPAAPPAAAPAAAPAAGDLHASGERGEKRVAMTRMRQRIAERLKAAQNAAAMLTTFNEVDMGNLVALRSELNSAFQETHGVKMGFVSAFMLAASQAIRKVPEVNAYIDGKEIVYKNYVDISIAVATPAGLVVPVVRDCHRKTWAQLEKDLAALADRARKGQIALEDMAGGTFTISNGGVYGSMMGTPIINPPQSSILGMHAVTKRAVVKDDQIVIRPMMYLALTYDHRLIDGREAVTFLRLIREYIEDPRKMLLGL